MAASSSIVLVLLLSSAFALDQAHFPASFRFGAATSAQQVEGAWNVSGKGESMWDHYEHTTPDRIRDGSTSDVAADSYHRFEEDIAALVQLRVHFYRFSLSWTRLFPQGTLNALNPDGVRYYNQLINGLLAAGVEPMVTIFHWDLPQRLNALGGWTNPIVVDAFAAFATRAFQLFGDRVRTWTTINEPSQYCQLGYSGLQAPFADSSGVGTYLCGHNMILAHARAYRIYDQQFRPSQKGRVGLVCNTWWYEPANNRSALDRMAADRSLQFQFGWFVHPIYSQLGDYPAAMRDRIDEVSERQEFPVSRLPRFTPEEVIFVRGTYDYLGLNHYSTFLVRAGHQPIDHQPSILNDVDVHLFLDPSWEITSGSPFAAVVPWGMRKILNWISDTYGSNVEILITENGYNGFRNEPLVDTQRVNYLNSYLQEVLNAINDGVNVTAYTFWALIDNWEWVYGYNSRFGLYRIDFDNDPDLTRVPKRSAMVYQNIITTRHINESFAPDDFGL